MPRSTARLLAPLLAAGLIATLSACGGDKAKDPDPSSSTSATESAAAAPMKDGTVEGVTVKGEQGETPKITWAKEGVTATDPVRQVLTKGDGETVQKDDKVFVQLWVGNGTKKKEAYSSYTGAPQLVTASTTQTLAVLADAIIDQPVGSRLLVAQSVSGAFGESGQADIGLKPDDTAVLVIDITGGMGSGAFEPGAGAEGGGFRRHPDCARLLRHAQAQWRLRDHHADQGEGPEAAEG